jgi:hypothetical protein
MEWARRSNAYLQVKGQINRQVMAEDLRGPVAGKGGQGTGGERANPYHSAGDANLGERGMARDLSWLAAGEAHRRPVGVVSLVPEIVR